MKHSARLLVAALVAAIPVSTYAHFKLLEPASWIVESERGDPQKAGPCGGTNTDTGTPSNTIGKAVGGQKLHVKVLETIYHPGHYLISLAVNSREELAQDPEVKTVDTEKGPDRKSVV